MRVDCFGAYTSCLVVQFLMYITMVLRCLSSIDDVLSASIHMPRKIEKKQNMFSLPLHKHRNTDLVWLCRGFSAFPCSSDI